MDSLKKIENLSERLLKFEYEEKIVCFLDILGFSEKNKGSERPCDMQIVKLLKSIENIIKDQVACLQIHQFADSIILSTDAKDINTLFNVLAKSISHVIYEETVLLTSSENNQLTWEQSQKNNESLNLIRGGITFGKVCMIDEDVITDEKGSAQGILPAITIGPAISKAHDLESKIAKYPRILIDNVAYRQIEQNDKSTLKYVPIDFDNERYFDFISFLKDSESTYWELTMQKLNKVAKYITHNSSQLDRNSQYDIKVKQGWMYQYICRTLGKQPFPNNNQKE
ncbi:hypothetical protein FYJ84_13205 [Veillonellaceae bacterium WCA-693-APC-5D-A]|uniref:Guanylate cyclase domain-containing protein n=1 Tax=Anaerovibrio slackiae TaxID=2652309 RepID=A0A6I2UGP0_9FIRM|nr:hypothetical protein [Anaerovibrio slackiae]MSU09927.1 hypothetical protein [Anaerovibrio slackiae]